MKDGCCSLAGTKWCNTCSYKTDDPTGPVPLPYIPETRTGTNTSDIWESIERKLGLDKLIERIEALEKKLEG